MVRWGMVREHAVREEDPHQREVRLIVRDEKAKPIQRMANVTALEPEVEDHERGALYRAKLFGRLRGQLYEDIFSSGAPMSLGELKLVIE